MALRDLFFLLEDTGARSAASRRPSVDFRVFFYVKGSRHLVLWALENLTGLLEILRQGTGCVKGRY